MYKIKSIILISFAALFSKYLFVSIVFRILFLFALSLLLNHASAQDVLSDRKYSYKAGGYTSRGFIIMHDEQMGHLSQSHTDGFSLFVKKQTYGNRYWEQLFRYPDLAVVFNYVDYNNPILGETFSALGTIDCYIVRNPGNALTFQFGFGVGYNTHPYDGETNNKNIALGSRITYAALARINHTLQLLPGLDLETGIKLSHFSNGAFKMPNKGINVVTADIGLSYDFNKPKLVYQKAPELPAVDRRMRYDVVLASGIKEIDPVGGRKYSFLTLSLLASKQTSQTNQFALGVDFFYSLATKEEIKIDRDLNGAVPDFKRVGIVGGHELLMGRLSFIAQVGAYVYRPYKSDKPIYQRYGFKYGFAERVSGGVFLKTHYGKADAVEWAIGFKI